MNQKDCLLVVDFVMEKVNQKKECLLVVDFAMEMEWEVLTVFLLVVQ